MTVDGVEQPGKAETQHCSEEEHPEHHLLLKRGHEVHVGPQHGQNPQEEEQHKTCSQHTESQSAAGPAAQSSAAESPHDGSKLAFHSRAGGKSTPWLIVTPACPQERTAQEGPKEWSVITARDDTTGSAPSVNRETRRLPGEQEQQLGLVWISLAGPAAVRCCAQCKVHSALPRWRGQICLGASSGEGPGCPTYSPKAQQPLERNVRQCPAKLISSAPGGGEKRGLV